MEGPISDFPVEYTFSEAELQDILGFMERQQADGAFDPSAASMPFLNPPNPGPVALQFQPHTYSLESTTQLPPTAEPLSFAPEEADTRSISSDPSPLRNSPSLEEPTARSDDADFVPPGMKQEVVGTGTWDLRQNRNATPLHAAMQHASLHTSGSGGNLRKGMTLHKCLFGFSLQVCLQSVHT